MGVLTVPLLSGLVYYGCFRRKVGLGDAIVDSLVAIALGLPGAIGAAAARLVP